MVKFIFNKRWELYSLNMLLGEQTLVDETIKPFAVVGQLIQNQYAEKEIASVPNWDT